MTSPTQATEIHHAIEAEAQGTYVHLGLRRVRLEYLLLAFLLAMAIAIGAVIIVFELGKDDVERWGYAGLFGIQLLRAASVLLPIPGGGIVFAAGGLLDPQWGIPAPVLVGVVAGFAESLGEFTGYAAGRSGTRVLDGRHLYERVKRWIKRRAFLTTLVMAVTPSPLFDVAGLAAGAARVPIRVFYPALLLGKVGRGIMIATLGYYGIELLSEVF